MSLYLYTGYHSLKNVLFSTEGRRPTKEKWFTCACQLKSAYDQKAKVQTASLKGKEKSKCQHENPVSIYLTQKYNIYKTVNSYRY